MKLSSCHGIYMMGALMVAASAGAQESGGPPRWEIAEIVVQRSWADTAGLCKAVGEIAGGASLVLQSNPVSAGVGTGQILHGWGDLLSAGLALGVDDLLGAFAVATGDSTYLQRRAELLPGEASSFLTMHARSQFDRDVRDALMMSIIGEYMLSMAVSGLSGNVPALAAVALCTPAEMVLDSIANRNTRRLLAAAPPVDEPSQTAAAASAQ